MVNKESVVPENSKTRLHIYGNSSLGRGSSGGAASQRKPASRHKWVDLNLVGQPVLTVQPGCWEVQAHLNGKTPSMLWN